MTPEIRQQLKASARQATTLSRQALEAMQAGDFQLSRTLIKEAAIAGKKCQVFLHENQSQTQASNPTK
ncbi:MAG: hypothetical protein AAGF26_01625 [Cyanobacteria bacterium P01_G01_bin.49]